MNKCSRQKAERQGRQAEFYAKLFLQIKGYRLLETRYKTKLGEIDLVMRKGKCVVFVEVKARKDHETAALSIYPQMQKRIEQASDIYVARTPNAQTLSRRFDVVFVLPGRFGLPKIIHQVDAWRAW